MTPPRASSASRSARRRAASGTAARIRSRRLRSTLQRGDLLAQPAGPLAAPRGSARSCCCHVVARELEPLELLLAGAELGQRLVDPRVLAPRLEQGVELVLEPLLRLAEAGQAGPGGEEQLAEAALARADLVARAGQAGVVDPEEGLERLLVQPAEEALEPLGRRPTVASSGPRSVFLVPLRRTTSRTSPSLCRSSAPTRSWS